MARLSRYDGQGNSVHRCRCPNDAMLIPLVVEVLDTTEPVRFFWCWSCQELFALLGEPARLVAGLGADGQGGWRVFRAVGSEPEVQAALYAAARVRL
jgi:hypothetical protein